MGVIRTKGARVSLRADGLKLVLILEILPRLSEAVALRKWRRICKGEVIRTTFLDSSGSLVINLIRGLAPEELTGVTVYKDEI